LEYMVAGEDESGRESWSGKIGVLEGLGVMIALE